LQARLAKRTTIYTHDNIDYVLVDGVAVASVRGLEHHPLTNNQIRILTTRNIPIHFLATRKHK
jgi:hypothetical protein